MEDVRKPDSSVHLIRDSDAADCAKLDTVVLTAAVGAVSLEPADETQTSVLTSTKESITVTESVVESKEPPDIEDSNSLGQQNVIVKHSTGEGALPSGDGPNGSENVESDKIATNATNAVPEPIVQNLPDPVASEMGNKGDGEDRHVTGSVEEPIVSEESRMDDIVPSSDPPDIPTKGGSIATDPATEVDDEKIEKPREVRTDGVDDSDLPTEDDDKIKDDIPDKILEEKVDESPVKDIPVDALEKSNDDATSKENVSEKLLSQEPEEIISHPCESRDKSISGDTKGSSSEPEEVAAVSVDDSTAANVGETPAASEHNTSKAADEDESPVNEDELLKGSDDQADENSSMNPDEMSMNLDETGDDDEEMQEFQHVKTKDLDTSEDMDVACATDVDPIGLVDEPDPKIDITDEHMDVDREDSQEGDEKPAEDDVAGDGDRTVGSDDKAVGDDDKADSKADDEKEIPGPEEVAMDEVGVTDVDHASATDVDPIGSSDAVDPFESSDATDPIASSDAVEPIASSDAVDPFGSSDVVDPIGSSDAVDPIVSSDAVDPFGSSDAVDPIGSSDVVDAMDTSDAVEADKEVAVAEAVETDAAEVVSGKAAVATTSTGTDAADIEPGDGESAAKPMSVPEEAGTADNDDEEICIIPDTIRVPPPGTVVIKPGEKGAKGKKNEVSIVASVQSVQSKEKGAHFITGRPQRQAAKRAESQIKELARDDSNSGDGSQSNSFKSDDVTTVEASMQICVQCSRMKLCGYQTHDAGKRRYLCSDTCAKTFRNDRAKSRTVPVGAAGEPGDEPFVRKCGQCSLKILGDDKNLAWETMDFCNEECLGKYQLHLGSFCANCKGSVASTSLGKYCVRFGYDIRQFCCSSCLEEFKKGLKVCSYCQKDISSGTDGFLAPVGNKGIFKDFCTQACMEKYDHMGNHVAPPAETTLCAVCRVEKPVQTEVFLDDKLHKLCSDPCFAAFKFVNKLAAGTCKCDMCKKHFDKMRTEKFSIFTDDAVHDFCNKTCMNVYILANRKIVPCNWCKVKKYNFDMIKRVAGNGQAIMMCSLNCLTLYQVSVNAVSSKKIKCDFCRKVNQAQYHLTMSDATIRNFCAYECVMKFQGQYSKSPPLTLSAGDKPVIPTGPIVTNGSKAPPITYTRRSGPVAHNDVQPASTMPVISSVTSLAPNGQQASQAANRASAKAAGSTNAAPPLPPAKPQVVYKQQVVVKPAAPKEMRNKSVGCKPMMVSKGSSCRPTTSNKESQTDDSIGRPIFIPVPVPIFVPAPMHMFSVPFPMPVPFPLPIPVPMFIPTSRNSIAGILKEMKRIQEKIPADPFEAELLMMAEMVAEEKKDNSSDSDSDDGGDNGAQDITDVPEPSSAPDGGFSPEAVDTSNFGEDMLQMALKMASELEEPAVDLEAALTPSTISAPPAAAIEHNDVAEADVDDPEPAERGVTRGRKRGMPPQRRGSMGTPSKRGRRVSSGGGGDVALLPPPEPPTTPRIEVEKPDANMCLKYTFGVNAWRQWVNAKNAELDKSNNVRKPLKLFKPEILQLTSDELNYSLCLFVKEVRKPNGSEYAPDTIYYLVLGIQQYLFENGRIDNIFTDAYYEKFTECLDEVAKNFSLLFNEQQYIVTRVEEEHLWESKQLGAHSPHVLLSTLMFFNTKHFNLTTVDEHMQLSFSHIMKHWKRNPNMPGATKVPGSRNVLLRFYPPQATLEANSRKKKVYEQQENEENPLRCPVKLYEFYLSKCPESVKTRNDVFYLLPERSCVPDSPVWYSTMALGKDPLVKMLHRVKMVKEINMALLTS